MLLFHIVQLLAKGRLHAQQAVRCRAHVDGHQGVSSSNFACGSSIVRLVALILPRVSCDVLY